MALEIPELNTAWFIVPLTPAVLGLDPLEMEGRQADGTPVLICEKFNFPNKYVGNVRTGTLTSLIPIARSMSAEQSTDKAALIARDPDSHAIDPKLTRDELRKALNADIGMLYLFFNKDMHRFASLEEIAAFLKTFFSGKKSPTKKQAFKIRNIATGRMSDGGGIDALFTEKGKMIQPRISAKGHLFHYVYGFGIDFDGRRRFHPRPGRSLDDYEMVVFEDGVEVAAIPGRKLFTRNQILNKEDRVFDGLTRQQIKDELTKIY